MGKMQRQICARCDAELPVQYRPPGGADILYTAAKHPGCKGIKVFPEFEKKERRAGGDGAASPPCGAAPG